MGDKVQFNVMITSRLAQQVRAIAEIDGRRPADVAEEALASYCAERLRDKQFQEQLRQRREELDALYEAMAAPEEG